MSVQKHSYIIYIYKKKKKHLLEADDTLKLLFLKNYIIVAKKSGRNLQERLTRADAYNIKSDLLDLSFHGYKKCG